MTTRLCFAIWKVDRCVIVHCNSYIWTWNTSTAVPTIAHQRYWDTSLDLIMDENCTRPLRCFVWSRKASWLFSLPHSSQNLLLPLLRFIWLSLYYIFVCFSCITVCLSVAPSICLSVCLPVCERVHYQSCAAPMTFLFVLSPFYWALPGAFFFMPANSFLCFSDSGRGSWGNQCCMETGALFCKMK